MTRYVEVSNATRVIALGQIQHGKVKWLKSNDEWDYYLVTIRREIQQLRVHKESKNVQAIHD